MSNRCIRLLVLFVALLLVGSCTTSVRDDGADVVPDNSVSTPDLVIDALTPSDLAVPQDLNVPQPDLAPVDQSDLVVEACGSDNYCNPNCASDPDCALNCESDLFCNTLCDSDPDCPICEWDHICVAACTNDKDCGCNCNANKEICEPKQDPSTEPCECDPDCKDGKQPCQLDGHCDTWCPSNTDPDCSCNCDFNDNICEPTKDPSSEPCACDPDCQGGKQPCQPDGHCDKWCPTNTDPDC